MGLWCLGLFIAIPRPARCRFLQREDSLGREEEQLPHLLLLVLQELLSAAAASVAQDEQETQPMRGAGELLALILEEQISSSRSGAPALATEALR